MNEVSQNFSFYERQLKDLKRNRDEAENKINSWFVKHINHLRQFHLQLITISLIILAAVIPLMSFENQIIFKTKILTYIGIACIFISLILTTFYLTHILISENRKLTSKRRFYNKSFGNEIKIIDKDFKNGTPFKDYYANYLQRGSNYLKQEKKLNKVSWIIERIDVIGWLLSITFLAGILSIGLSFFKIN